MGEGAGRRGEVVGKGSEEARSSLATDRGIRFL